MTAVAAELRSRAVFRQCRSLRRSFRLGARAAIKKGALPLMWLDRKSIRGEPSSVGPSRAAFSTSHVSSCTTWVVQPPSKAMRKGQAPPDQRGEIRLQSCAIASKGATHACGQVWRRRVPQGSADSPVGRLPSARVRLPGFFGGRVADANQQAEFARPIWDYIASAVSPQRIERGRAKAQTVSAWLKKANEAFGVDAGVIMGIWGLETDFGGYTGSDDVIRALASLASVRFRDDYFRDELLSALVILEEGDIEPRAMRGSWAGAMGQTQFM